MEVRRSGLWAPDKVNIGCNIFLFLPITLCFPQSHIPRSPFYLPSDSSPRSQSFIQGNTKVTAAIPGIAVNLISLRKVRKQQTETLVFLLSIQLFYALIF